MRSSGLGSAFGRAIFLLAMTASSASSQSVILDVRSAESGLPIAGAIARLVGSDSGAIERSALTDERGRALFVGVPPGLYMVRAEMVGMATTESEPFDVAPGTPVPRVVRMESAPIAVEGLTVALASDRCTVRPEGGALVAKVWEEARKALASASLLDEAGSYRYETVKYERQLQRETAVVLEESRESVSGVFETPYESRPAEDLVSDGFVQDDGNDDVFFAPDAAVLLSDAFLDTHCFHLAEGSGTEGRIGLSFRPTGGRSVPDIAGTMWVDLATSELRWVEFTYQHLEPERMSPEVGGRVDFERMPNGKWIVSEWWIRMPLMARQTDARGLQRHYIARYKQTGGVVVDVHETGGSQVAQVARTGGIEGIVRDSLGVPVQGVAVGVVGSNQQVYTDGEGRFGITGLPEGRYQVQVVPSEAEPEGLTPDPIVRDVAPGSMSRVEFRLPSVRDMLFATCEAPEEPEDGGVLTGVVVDSLGVPVTGATVRLQWARFDFSGVVSERRVEDLRETDVVRTATSDDGGRYSFCDVPRGRTLLLSASRTPVESGPRELLIPEDEMGEVQRLALVAPMAAEAVPSAETTVPVASPTSSASTIRGTLLDADSRAPISLGLVLMYTETGDSITSAMSDENGRFSVASPDPGSFMLRAAALGYQESDAGVFELGDSASMTIEYLLEPAPLPMDALMVEIDRPVLEHQLVQNGFVRRLQRGLGKFITPHNIEETTATSTEGLMLGIPGVRVAPVVAEVPGHGRVEAPFLGETVQIAKGARWCEPTVYMDGVRTTYDPAAGITLSQVAHLDAVEAIEVYRRPAEIPVEFASTTDADCGVLVVWTKQGAARGRGVRSASATEAFSAALERPTLPDAPLSDEPLRPGERIRLQLDPTTSGPQELGPVAEGTFTGSRPGALVIRDVRTDLPRPVRLSDIQEVQVARARGAADAVRRGAIAGAVAGAGTAGFLTLLCEFTCRGGQSVRSVAMPALGVGLLVGTLVWTQGPGDDWVRAPLPDTRAPSSGR